jgi:hypothetical protein
MFKYLLWVIFFFVASPVHAWGFATGKVEVFYVNTYGNFLEGNLNGGFCFKLVGFSHYFKIAHADSGEKRSNLLLVQSMVLAAHMSGKELKATFVDWGDDASCRVNGAAQPAKWLENLQLLNN